MAEEIKNEEVCEVTDDFKTKYLYALADLDNVRKQSARRVGEATSVANENFVRDILPIVDDFERANNSENVPDGVIMVYRKLMSVLSSKGVEKMNAIGEKFDLNNHEAVAEIPSDQDGVIIDCIQEGYTMNGKVIRYAKVVVGKAS